MTMHTDPRLAHLPLDWSGTRMHKWAPCDGTFRTLPNGSIGCQGGHVVIETGEEDQS